MKVFEICCFYSDLSRSMTTKCVSYVVMPIRMLKKWLKLYFIYYNSCRMFLFKEQEIRFPLFLHSGIEIVIPRQFIFHLKLPDRSMLGALSFKFFYSLTKLSNWSSERTWAELSGELNATHCEFLTASQYTLSSPDLEDSLFIWFRNILTIKW